MRVPVDRPRVPTHDTRKVPPPPKQTDPVYSSQEYMRWRGAVVLRANGRCQDPSCVTPRRTGMRLFADHIVELRDGGEPFSVANGLARCGACHTRKTLKERAIRAKSHFRQDRGPGSEGKG